MTTEKRGQLSLRPTERTLDGLARQSQLRDEKPSVLAERYLREGLLMDEHQHVHFVDGAIGRRPAIAGTGLDVWEIVEVVKDNQGSIEASAAYLEVDPRLIEAAVGFYGANRAEIDAWIERVRSLAEREEARWRAAREAISS